MAQSLALGERVSLSKVDAFAGRFLGRLIRVRHMASLLLCWAAVAGCSSWCRDLTCCCGGVGRYVPLWQQHLGPCSSPHSPAPHPIRLQLSSDGVAVKYVGAETFRLCRDLIDGVVLVDNAATSAAIKVGTC